MLLSDVHDKLLASMGDTKVHVSTLAMHEKYDYIISYYYNFYAGMPFNFSDEQTEV